MLNIQALQQNKEIESQPKDIDIIVNDDGQIKLAFELPSATSLRASHCKIVDKISVVEISEQDPFNFKELFRKEFVNLANKRERFKHSRSFTLKLAGAATLSGDLDSAETLLADAAATNENQKLLHKLGDTLILQGRFKQAIEAFEKTDLDSDVYSNLKLAYIHTRNNNIPTAYSFLEKAQLIDPTDFRTRMFMGGIQLNSGQCEKAIRSFRVASLSKKDSSVLHVNLAASHWSLGHMDKATKELRKALSINPLNENALIFYADSMHQSGQNEKTIPFLEYFVSLNQKSKYVWERLARACYFTNRLSRAKSALEHQQSLADEPNVYNNLGLVYWQLNKHSIALKYLNDALVKAQDDSKDYAIPVLNIAILLNEMKQYAECSKLLKKFIAHNNKDVDGRVLAKIAIQYFISLEALEERKTAAIELANVLNMPNIDNEGKALLLCCKIYSDVVILKNRDECDASTATLLDLLRNSRDEISDDTARFAYNNIAFNSLLFNSIADAQYYLGKVMKYINIDPYCTATLGLLHIKKGNIEVGSKLYEKAISLANSRELKDRIRQRMNFELGKYLLSVGSNKDAAKYLSKAIKEVNGYKYVTSEANNLLKSIL